MTSSHPPTLLKVVERTLRHDCQVQRNSKILLAVSGGSDSMAMLHVMSMLAPKLGLKLFAHGVDHGLRPEAKLELDGVAKFAAKLAVPFSSSRIEVSLGSNLQARARAQRYEALRLAARDLGAETVATAHHADDRAETVLMRLLRGAGPRGLGVLPARSADLLRPLIRARKSDVLSHLQRHEIHYFEDPSNANRRYLRSRVRHQLLPALHLESPGIVEHLNALADRMLECATDENSSSLGLSRSQTQGLRRMISSPKDGGEIALAGGWVLKFERRKIPMIDPKE
jgi:tRNA(Ile)-lysidine synthase